MPGLSSAAFSYHSPIHALLESYRELAAKLGVNADLRFWIKNETHKRDPLRFLRRLLRALTKKRVYKDRSRTSMLSEPVNTLCDHSRTNQVYTDAKALARTTTIRSS